MSRRGPVFVPLVVAGQATGVISLQNLDREHAFSDADVRLLTTLAGSLSVALENARLFEETRQRNAELALVNDVQRGLAENLDMQAMYDLVGDRIQEIFDAQVVDIGDPRSRGRAARIPVRGRTRRALPDEPWTSGRSASTSSRRASRSSSTTDRGAVAELGRRLHLRASRRSPRSTCRSSSAGRRPGVISLQNIDREHAFSEADVRLLTTLAGSLSVALENARLFEETRQRNAELALINDVQRGLAENLEMQAMYDLVGDRLREIFDAQVVTSASSTRRGTHPLPLHHREGRALRGRARASPTGSASTSSKRANHFCSTSDHAGPARRVRAAGGRSSGNGPRSSVWVRSIVAGGATGVISLQNVEREQHSARRTSGC